MAVEVRLPELGEGITSGTVVSVRVKVGDAVEADQAIIEIETDKAIAEVPTTDAGTVESIAVSEGDVIEIGALLMTLSGGASPAKAAPAPEKAPEAPKLAAEPAPAPTPAPAVQSGATSTVEVRLPELGENIESGTVVSVLVKAGDAIAVDQPMLEIETDKAVAEVPAPVGGKVKAVHAVEGEKLEVGGLVLTVTTSDAPAAAPAAPAAPAEAPAKPAAAPAPEAQTASSAQPSAPRTAPGPKPAGKPVPAAPSVRRLAREIGVDITEVKGTGPSGRISESDVKDHSRRKHTEAAPAAPAAGAVPARDLPDFSRFGSTQREAMSNVRRKTAEHESFCWATVPHVFQFDKADVTDLEAWRSGVAKRIEAKGGKLTVTAVLLKLCAEALRTFPQFNASVDTKTNEVVLKDYVNIGVAVDTPRGLLVPVVRDVDKKSITELSLELTELAGKARNGKLSLEDMQGGCFTISNLGGIGGTSFTPIVNWPEVAILGVSRTRVEPVFVDGEFKPRQMMPVCLSYDHRVIDGADGARFIRWLVEALEQPLSMLL